MSKNHWQQIVSGGLAFSLAVACAEQARTVQAPSSNGSTDNCEPPFTRYDESLGKIIGNIVQSDASKFIESHPVETGGKEVYGYCLGDTNTYWVVDSQEGTVDIFVEVGEGRVNKLAGKSIGSGEITDSVWFYTDENGNPTNSQALSIDLPQGSNKDIFINLTNPDGSSTNEDIFIVTPNFELASKVNLKPISITSVDGSELILTPTPPPPGLTVTETLAPTATPEPTATAKPEIIVQQEVTFDLTNGEEYSMPGFFANFPEDATPEQIADIEKRLLEKAFEFIANDNVAWGDLGPPRDFNMSKSDKNFFDNIYWKLPDAGKVFAGGWIVPPNVPGGIRHEPENQFYTGILSVTHNEITGTVIRYTTANDNHFANMIYVGAYPERIVSLIKTGAIEISKSSIQPPLNP